MFCGIDEAGRGPVMGPLVVASVFVEDDSALREIGVRDSKKLTPSSREAMFESIVKSNAHRIVILS
ncbi:MAG: ribonuclease HII, partial [Methanomassiliicoccaceae archaeon]|nr:ribonuclease HII [Methanomassiliicoccaceae archaeon]